MPSRRCCSDTVTPLSLKVALSVQGDSKPAPSRPTRCAAAASNGYAHVSASPVAATSPSIGLYPF